ncbi:hypothetical protein MUK70_05600 [Dyadobacter chenwenxiniae]|uniref:Uncharacterized protein n=1 Tax=Dyadobacter chenwenxiniae TaxID=2906456 RepID=A0A9X1PTB3_9BACT|nr:hypothetical protein [Dyadobacter chenwenxiniae]MCF0050487.1 hypothetical protein [Dyadobacter chenwenxiniae]MCF0065268.1 hypothetical protein [Dyadobacter chenwenxiniae]UON84464.1 hypothetical protein MUK70_05600 [Dyadobacter chenwenxiniae]
MKPEIRSLAGGLAGAIVLNIIHEAAKRFSDKAPRIDKVGEEALTKSLHAVGASAPTGNALFGTTLAADLASNAMYYAMIGKGSKETLMLRGAGYGLFAGLGAIGLTQKLGLSDKPVTKTTETKVMTVAWYLLGGLAAAFVMQKVGEYEESTGKVLSF